MRVTVYTYGEKAGHEATGYAEHIVADRLDNMRPGEQTAAVGRLVDLLLDKGLVTPVEVGQAMFREDWR